MNASIPKKQLALYGLAAVLAAAELVIFIGALNPQVSDTYRARYIEGRSNCWLENVTGEIELGATISAAKPDIDAILPLLRCGWLAPEVFGTWTVGEEAKLRFKLPADRTDLALDIEFAPFGAAHGVVQQVIVSAEGEQLARLVADSPDVVTHRIIVPSTIPLDDRGYLEVTFTLPDAVSGKQLGLNDYDRRRFGIRMMSLRLAPA